MSFNIALSGLNATNNQLNTISNNIANVSTTGFKESRTEFSSVYNGNQAGGVEVASISQNFDKNGSITGTGRPLDLAIGGAGFFVVKDAAGQMAYTRSGVFGTDKNNNIITNTGMTLQGYGVNSNNELQTGMMTDLTISQSTLPAKASDSIEFIANFDARAKVIDTTAHPFDAADTDSFNSSYTSKVFDSLGNPHTVTQYFTKTADNTWQINVEVNGSPVTGATAQTVQFNTDGSVSSPTAPFNVAFNPPGAEPMSLAIDLKGSSQFGSDFSVSTNAANGYASGELAGVRVEESGMVFATFTNGQSQLQGQVVLADFANPQAMGKLNGSAWSQTYASGTPVYGVPGTGTLGGLSAGALEGSNVDLTSELVNLMAAQRNYQANAKTISTSDKLTQALFNAL